VIGWALIELVEAGARSRRPEVAAGAFRRLGDRTRASGTEWALGIEARSRALLSDGQAADALYREAIDRLARTRVAVHLARRTCSTANGCVGRTASWTPASNCVPPFSRIGAESFAERARRELQATGEVVRKPPAQTLDKLTAQEAQIARLAHDGQTNPEIGAQLFLSPRTVEWHPRKVFTKLDITSRKELR
jgi:DNA-binding CsgD family transcriptional regulator